MAVSYRTGIAILQFIFFLPSLCLATYLCFAQGAKNAGTWRYIVTLSGLRVAGAISTFVSLSHPSLNVEVAIIVCELSGLAPLMLTCVALVGRVNKTSRVFPVKSLLIISIMALAGLILGIVGTTRSLQSASTTSDVSVNRLTTAALALFLAGYGILAVAYLALVIDAARSPSKRVTLGTEIWILYTVGLTAPLVLVRLIYSAVGDYSQNPAYGPLYGNNTIYLFMDVLMEVVAAAICLASAFLIPLPKEDKKEGEASESSNPEGGEAAMQPAEELGIATTEAEEGESKEATM